MRRIARPLRGFKPSTASPTSNPLHLSRRARRRGHATLSRDEEIAILAKQQQHRLSLADLVK